MFFQKRYKVINNLILILAITALLITGCFDNSNTRRSNMKEPKYSSGAKFPVIVTDQMGRQVTIRKLPVRIVSLAPSNTEILFALGLEDRIVGVTDYCDYPEDAKNKQKVGGYSDPNLEKLISLEPDLIVADDINEKIVKEMEKLDIPSIVLNPNNLEEMFESITLVGKATSKEEQAAALVENLRQRVLNIENKVADILPAERPKVYYEIWPEPITTAGPGSFVHDLIQRAGGENVAKDAEKAYPQYSQEMILAKNPDIIIFSHHGSSSQSAEDIIRRPGWKNINAVSNNKVFHIDENILQRATPRLIDGLEELAVIIHPELFD